MSKLDDYLQIAEAAEYLGVCKNTLRNWCESGKLTEYRHPINNYRLFKVTDLNRILKLADKPRKASKPR
jgi:DNA (cytosine-5)-methyltransferase 1